LEDGSATPTKPPYDAMQDMGRLRFRQGVPVSELVYALLITKQHLRRHIREHGLVDFAGDRVTPDELLRSNFTPSRNSTIRSESSSTARSITWPAVTRRRPVQALPPEPVAREAHVVRAPGTEGIRT
jgi:hypothetical protein